MLVGCSQSRSLLLLSLISLSILSANAAYVQWKYCEGSSIGDFIPISLQAQLVPSGLYTKLGMTVKVNSPGTASCTQLLDSSNDIILEVDMLGLSAEYNISADGTCVPPPADVRSQRPLPQYSELNFNIWQELNLVGPLPTFSIDLYLGPNKSSPITCIHSEMTPQLHRDISIALRCVPPAILLFVSISALLTALYATASPTQTNLEQESHSEAPSRMQAILPSVGNCLQYLQFIFLTGALTLHYPGFYQPVTSYFSWASLFNPIGPITHGRTYPSVKDGIYEINGTLTGASGLELMAQVTGGPMTMDIWHNMVILVLIIAAATALFVQIPRAIPCIEFSSISDPPTNQQPRIKRMTWNVLKVILSYFVTPIVAISAYQLSNSRLPSYHLALSTLLIALLLFVFAWMAWNLPTRELGALVLGGSKRYRRLGLDHGPETGNTFILIFFTLAFARGAVIGGLQMFPLVQITLLAISELSLFISAVVLRPFRSLFSVFTVSCVTRFVVVVLSSAFLPTLNASTSTRSLVGYIILLLHAAVIVLGCLIPGFYRLGKGACTSWGPNDEPEIYGISQLRRRSTAINGLSSPTTYDNGTDSQYVASSPVGSNSNPSSLPLDGASSLNVYQMPRYYRTPRLRAFSSHSSGLSNLVPLIPMSPHSESCPVSTTTSPKATTEPEIPPRSISTTSDNSSNSVPLSTPGPPLATSLELLAPRWPDYTFREADLYYGRPYHVDARDDEANDSMPTPRLWRPTRLYFVGVLERLMDWKEEPPKQSGTFQVIRPWRPNEGFGNEVLRSSDVR